MVKKEMGGEHWSKDADKGISQKLKKNLFQCYLFHHKSQINRPGIDPN